MNVELKDGWYLLATDEAKFRGPFDSAEMALDPPVSEKQRRAMWAAAEGRSTLGIPESVGKEFVGDQASPLLHSAGVALKAPDGKMLFLKRGAGADHPGTWCFPGGGREAGETPEAAARRELKEETGYAHEGELHPADIHRGFATFIGHVPSHFAAKPDDEHVGFAWAHPDDPPEPLHPGVKSSLGLSRQAGDASGAADERLAWDRKSVRSFDSDGRLHIKRANISKANICPYRGREIPNSEALGLDPDRIYQLYRDPEELRRGAATFNNLPILSEHVPVSAKGEATHRPDLIIGSTGTDAGFDNPFLSNSLVFWARPAIEAIHAADEDPDEASGRKELSSAYRYRADMTPGEVNGVKFDGVMRDIIGNHVALVREGRAGSDVIVGDSKPRRWRFDAFRPRFDFRAFQR